VPALSAALAYYDGYRTEQLPANLLQAQRDYFGAHAYERVDAPRGMLFHTEWTCAPQNPAASADPPLLPRRGQTGVW
jgi:6-phosphogluconate dehydrogenase